MLPTKEPFYPVDSAIINQFPSLHHRGRTCNLTLVSNVCEAVPISLFWAPNRPNQILHKLLHCKMRFEFPINLIGKLTMAFLTVLSWHVLKSWYTLR